MLSFCGIFAQSTVTKTNTTGCGMPYILAMKNGGSYEQTSYDSKGNATNVFKNIVEKNNNGEVIIRQEGHDVKNKEWEPTSISFLCTGDGLIMDPKSMMQIGDLKFKDKSGKSSMNIKNEVSGDKLIIRKNMKVGDNEPDAKIAVKMIITGMMPMNSVSNILLKNRKIVLQEKIKTPIGEFNCFLLEHDVDSETDIMGMKMTSTSHVKMWFCEERGIVRMEIKNEKMKKLNLTQVMTAWNF